ncbi:MAG: UV DNA damage repair endonuclease UvsE [Vallitalea sp.]|jgi:UV DNA damage endonuclease|nr:UV DNA damage repair endonuclease UvsE [Vallitalea sp.]
MKIRLGYVAIALKLDKVTSSSTITYKYYSKLTSEQKLNKLKQVTLSNINDLEKILMYNIKNNIHFYRLTSALIPLATHPDVVDWDYRKYFNLDFEHIGKIIKNNNMRVDVHADQFNVINSINPQVVKNTQRNLLFLATLLEDMNIENGKIIIHVGSSQGGKEKALNRFITNFKQFPRAITEKIIIENDDKIFDIIDVLELCEKIKTPMVLDVHHYNCNNRGEDLYKYIKDIFNTWNGDYLIPKIHFSSPKESQYDRRHADYIYAKDFINFINNTKDILNNDFDIMLESKKKEIALFKLIEDVKSTKKEWNYIDKTTFEI